MALSTDGPPWGSVDPGQAESSVSVLPSFGPGVFGFHKRTEEMSALCEKLSMKAADGADLISVFYLVL